MALITYVFLGHYPIGLSKRVDKEDIEWKDSPLVSYFTQVRDGMKKGLKNRDVFFRPIATTSLWTYSKLTTMPRNEVTAKVILLTDGHCASACLDFADLLLAMPGVIHIGSVTSGDTSYMEVRDITLPSGVAGLSLATKVYRNRPRGYNEFYTPRYVWEGEMSDTVGLKA